MSIFNAYVAYRGYKAGKKKYLSTKEKVQRKLDRTLEGLTRGCQLGNDCAFLWAVRDIRTYTVHHSIYLQELQDDLQWHKEHSVPIEAKAANWRTSETIIHAMCYEKGEPYVSKTILSPALKLVYETIDYSGSEYLDGLDLIASHLASNGGHQRAVMLGKQGYREVFVAAAAQQEGIEEQQIWDEMSGLDWHYNVPGLGH